MVGLDHNPERIIVLQDITRLDLIAIDFHRLSLEDEWLFPSAAGKSALFTGFKNTLAVRFQVALCRRQDSSITAIRAGLNRANDLPRPDLRTARRLPAN
jgi:hypothetical protein